MLMGLPQDYLPKAIAGMEALAKTACATRFCNTASSRMCAPRSRSAIPAALAEAPAMRLCAPLLALLAMGGVAQSAEARNVPAVGSRPETGDGPWQVLARPSDVRRNCPPGEAKQERRTARDLDKLVSASPRADSMPSGPRIPMCVGRTRLQCSGDIAMIANRHFRRPPAMPTLHRGRSRRRPTQEDRAPCREPRRYRPLRRPPRLPTGSSDWRLPLVAGSSEPG